MAIECARCVKLCEACQNVRAVSLRAHSAMASVPVRVRPSVRPPRSPRSIGIISKIKTGGVGFILIDILF